MVLHRKRDSSTSGTGPAPEQGYMDTSPGHLSDPTRA